MFDVYRHLSLREFLKTLVRKFQEDAVSDNAAQLSYYFLFSLFPLLFFFVTLAAYLPIHGLVQGILERATSVMPASAYSLVREHLDVLLTQTRPKLLTAGLIGTLWAASRGVNAMRTALNLAYDVPESRPFWKTQLLALGTTIVGTLLVLLSLIIVILGGQLGFHLAEKLSVAREFATLWSWLRWPAVALIIMFVFALSYYWLPDVKQQFKYITPGSILGTLLWLLSTWGFTQYVDHFGTYNATYGSIGGVMVLLLWLYITGLTLILGGEVNAILEHASPEGKARGARAEGEELTFPPDTPQSAAKSAKAARRTRWLWKRRPS